MHSSTRPAPRRQRPRPAVNPALEMRLRALVEAGSRGSLDADPEVLAAFFALAAEKLAGPPRALALELAAWFEAEAADPDLCDSATRVYLRGA